MYFVAKKFSANIVLVLLIDSRQILTFRCALLSIQDLLFDPQYGQTTSVKLAKIFNFWVLLRYSSSNIALLVQKKYIKLYPLIAKDIKKKILTHF